jgi:hypothetical protein
MPCPLPTYRTARCRLLRQLRHQNPQPNDDEPPEALYKKNAQTRATTIISPMNNRTETYPGASL